MEKQVKYRDQQELQAADLNNTQKFAADSIKHVVADAISAGIHFTGLNVTAQGSNTALDIAAGRLFDAGQVYVVDQVSELDLFSHLPLTTQKVVAVVVWGQSIDTDIQPRDYLIDLEAGTTQPQSVAMEQLNQTVINALPGVESADPQAPATQSGTLVVALVTLSPTGITSITMQIDNLLPNTADHEQRIKQQEIWKSQAEPRISSVATDLAALATQTESMAKMHTIVDLASEVARIKEQLNLPVGTVGYDADDFKDDSKSDTGHAGYAAIVDDEAILFPHVASQLAPVDTFSPSDPSVTRSADGVILPTYSENVALKVDGYAGDMSISQFQTQSIQIRRRTVPESALQYGALRNPVKYWAVPTDTTDGQMVYGYHSVLGYRYQTTTAALRTYRSVDAYLPEAATTNINGALLAQTFLASNATWLTSVGLQFTDIGATGDLHLIVCGTIGGKPNVDDVVGDVVVPVADLKKYPEETVIPVSPVLLEAGKRYTLVLVTQGDHRVAIVSGDKLTSGTLFNGTDGDYFTGDITKDLMFTLYSAMFASPRTEVALQSVSLAGGITDLNMKVQSVIPPGASLDYELQVGGIWYRLDDDTNHLTAAPSIVPLRAVFLGTNDLAAALQTGTDLLTASRSAEALEHWGITRTLAAPAADFQIDLIVDHNYDNTTDTCVASIESGGTSYPATSAEELPQTDGSILLRFHFAAIASISTYQIKILATRSAASIPFCIDRRLDVAL